jgi:hypothetical protein
VCGYSWEKYFFDLFHVPEHVDHFRDLKKKQLTEFPGFPDTVLALEVRMVLLFISFHSFINY